MNRFLPFIAIFAAIAALCACSHTDDTAAPIAPKMDLEQILASSDSIDPRWDSPGIDAPDQGALKVRLRHLGPLKQAFRDSNYIQIGAARALGISPIHSDADILTQRRPLVRISSCQDFYVDNLTHSFPFLVPEAEALLHDIGRAFSDSLRAQGGGQYRIKVTSVLRTPATVAKLRRVNRNATSESTHVYGTTFDISHSKFICDGIDGPTRSFEDLKNLLAEVLDDLRHQGRCYVIYEARQSCFHITARPVDGVEYPDPKPEKNKK